MWLSTLGVYMQDAQSRDYYLPAIMMMRRVSIVSSHARSFENGSGGGGGGAYCVTLLSTSFVHVS